MCTCNSAGAVFNLICDDNDELVMSKIEQYFDIQVPEVNSLSPHPTLILSYLREDWNLQIIYIRVERLPKVSKLLCSG